MSPSWAAGQISVPWDQMFLEEDGGQLVSTVEQVSQQSTIITFDLRNSALPLQIAFPVLVANIADWHNNRTSFG